MAITRTKTVQVKHERGSKHTQGHRKNFGVESDPREAEALAAKAAAGVGNRPVEHNPFTAPVEDMPEKPVNPMAAEMARKYGVKTRTSAPGYVVIENAHEFDLNWTAVADEVGDKIILEKGVSAGPNTVAYTTPQRDELRRQERMHHRFNADGVDESEGDDVPEGLGGYTQDGYKSGLYTMLLRPGSPDPYVFDEEGFNAYGRDRRGSDRDGFDWRGYDVDGFDKDGFDRYGKDRDGYNRDGFNADGYDRDGYNDRGYDVDGFDRDGYNHVGRDRDGYNRDGFDSERYDRDGYSKDGFDRTDIHRETGTEFAPDGYNRRDIDAEGFNRRGFKQMTDVQGRGGLFTREGWDEDGRHHLKTGTRFGPDGFNAYGRDAEGYDRAGLNLAGFNREGRFQNSRFRFDKHGRDVDGRDKHGYDKRGWNRRGLHESTGKKFDEDGYDVNGLNRFGITNRATDGLLSLPDADTFIKGDVMPRWKPSSASDYDDRYERSEDFEALVSDDDLVERAGRRWKLTAKGRRIKKRLAAQ